MLPSSTFLSTSVGESPLLKIADVVRLDANSVGGYAGNKLHGTDLDKLLERAQDRFPQLRRQS